MKNIIKKLQEDGNFRKLHTINTLQRYIISGNKQYLNLSSNDYLGLGNTELQNKFLKEVDFSENFYLGTPSSRLMTGNVESYDLLENKIAELFGKESALVLGSGFLLNSGALPALTTSKDLVIADKLVHASIIEGLKLASCKFTRFKHNDMPSLETILKREVGNYDNIIVVTESIFSMDGDVADISELVRLKKIYGFKIYLDEAHAFGVRGERGCGVAEELGLLQEIDYLVATMGKALASQGAFIVCDSFTRTVLINRMRTLIFSTALPPLSLMWSCYLISEMPHFHRERSNLTKLSTKLSTLINKDVHNPHNLSHIIPVIVGDNVKVGQISDRLKNMGYWVTAIRHPTVPVGGERLRISLNASMQDIDIERFAIDLEIIFSDYGIEL